MAEATAFYFVSKGPSLLLLSLCPFLFVSLFLMLPSLPPYAVFVALYIYSYFPSPARSVRFYLMPMRLLLLWLQETAARPICRSDGPKQLHARG